MLKKLSLGLLAAALAGCATVEISSPGSLKDGERLLVLQSDGYTLFYAIPLWSGGLTWDEEANDVDVSPHFFQNCSDTIDLYKMAKKIAERENCTLKDVTFIDNHRALDLAFYGIAGLIKANDTAISAVLCPKQTKGTAQ